MSKCDRCGRTDLVEFLTFTSFGEWVHRNKSWCEPFTPGRIEEDA